MNTENQELLLLTGKMLYQLHMHEKSGSTSHLDMAYTYKMKAEAVLNKMDEVQASSTSNKMYIAR